MLLNLHSFLPRSTENGPGARAVIWVQGCTLDCPGCFNPATHDLAPRRLLSVQDLIQRIAEIDGIEGLTISGGEPFLQAGALAELGGWARAQNLGVIVFTGFTFEHLQRQPKPDWTALLAWTDLLIAGPFMQTLATHSGLRGSSNQTLHFLTDRYAHLRESLETGASGVEVLIKPSGEIILTGFPDQDFV